MATVEKSDGNLPTYDQVNNLCKEIFDDTISQQPYQHMEAVKWNTNIVESITQGLVGLNPYFKYCVSIIIMQAGLGAGLNVASTCYWDRHTDASYSIKWETKSVVAVCTIFAVNYATRT
uniref:Dynein light chain Tctex-type 1 n=1 Tax=Panagrolaimus sp. PS1159 TaxID=55785 RepID=A0AC35G3S6_9BILA